HTVRSLPRPSMRHRVHDVIDTEVEGCGCIVHRHVASVQPLPELANVVVVIQDHLEMSVTVSETEELHGMLAGENVWSLHVQRVDLVKRIKNRIRQIQVNEVPVRIHLLHLLAKVSDVVLGPTSGLPREVRGTKIIDEQKAAAVQVLTQVDDVFRVQFQISGLAKI